MYRNFTCLKFLGDWDKIQKAPWHDKAKVLKIVDYAKMTEEEDESYVVQADPELAEDKFIKARPSLVISETALKKYIDVREYMWLLEEMAKSGSVVIHFEKQFGGSLAKLPSSILKPVHCRGDLSFYTNSKEISDVV